MEPRRSPRLKRLGRDSSMPPLMGKLPYRNGGGDAETSESENEDALRKRIKPSMTDFEMLKNEDKNGLINIFDDERFVSRGSSMRRLGSLGGSAITATTSGLEPTLQRCCSISLKPGEEASSPAAAAPVPGSCTSIKLFRMLGQLAGAVVKPSGQG